jgi:site-specific recombinase XerD
MLCQNTCVPHDLPDLAELLPSWLRAMRGANRSPATIALYGGGVNTFLRWCAHQHVAAVLTRDSVNAFVADLLNDGAEPATAVARQKALRQYSNWLAAEGELKDGDPLLGLARPQQMTKVTHALTDDQLTHLVKACQGTTFLDRRDEAIVRLMAETGLRAGELIALSAADIDLDRGQAVVRKPKGGKQRVVPFGPKTVAALDRYLRMRRRIADTPALWVSVHGTRFTYSGLTNAIKARAKAAGINNFHLHLMRHTAATRWLRAGGSEQGLMAVAGWASRSMLDRYTAASASERAADEARKLNLGEL